MRRKSYYSFDGGKCVYLFLIAVLYSSVAFGQQTQVRTVTGNVFDENDQPLPGVTIIEAGTNNGTTSAIDGGFSLIVSNSKNNLVFSFIGYKTTTVPIPQSGKLRVVMEEDAKLLEEIVVVGYGTQKKVNLTGAVSTISSEALTSRPVGQASAALQGVAAGVTVVQNSGKPGGDEGTIRIRGIGTLNNSNPLVLIDGIEGSLNNINPNVIESISVLKDAASASIYGSRAANGVILVTTKRAKSKQLSVKYNTSSSWQRPTDLPDMVNAVDHMILTNEGYVNTGREPLYPEELIEGYINEGAENPDLYPDTDWQKEVLTGSGFMQNHFVSISGGGDNIRYLTSVGYFDQEGIIENSGFNRFTIRNNADLKLSDKLNMKFDVQLLSELTKEPGRSASSVFHWMNRIPANQPGINSNGTYGMGWNGANPIAFTRQGGGIEDKRREARLNVSLDYQPVEWLKAEVTVAPRFAEYTYDRFYGAINTYHPDGSLAATSPSLSTLTKRSSESMYNNYRGTLTLNKEFGDHGINILVGASREDYHNDFFEASREGYDLPDYPVLDAGSAENQQNSGSAAEWALQSFFGRIKYDYNQRYLFEINGRYDGSSRFASGHKYGFFPSISAGWRISEESFMEPLRNVVNELKFRGSWGTLGNQNIGNYPFASAMSIGSYTINDQIVNIAALNTMANTQITWETTEMTDFGVDLLLFSKLEITADYFYRRTKDILYRLDIPLTMGMGAPYQNAGIVDNKGWELAIGYHGDMNDLNYDISFNISDVKNEVIDLRGVNRSGLTVSHEGYPINSIYGLQAIGFFQSEDEIANEPGQFGDVKPGDIKYKDQNKDGIINDEDNIIIGSTIPRYTYGATVNASFKGFDLNAFFQGVGKADGYLYQQGIMPFFNGGTVQEQHKDRWTPENTDAAFPRLTVSAPNNEKNSSFWVKDASYLRLKNLQIGYNIPGQLVQKLKIQNLRIYISGQNVFSIDNFWNGYDVEAPVGRGDVYPQVKVYTVGLDVKF
jgi:TonB-linked SusC/RagA family outer membrane protein